jgi:integrase
LPICHPTAAAIFQMVALTGARPSEIRDLEWVSVDLAREPSVLRLHRHKTVRLIGEKTIVLSPLARGVLVSLNPRSPEHPRWVFPSHVRGRGGEPYNDITKPWRRVAAAAGVGRINLRDLRSGAATNAYDKGVPVELVQRMLGHRSLATTLKYTHISPHKVADAYSVMLSSVFSTSTSRTKR